MAPERLVGRRGRPNYSPQIAPIRFGLAPQRGKNSSFAVRGLLRGGGHASTGRSTARANSRLSIHLGRGGVNKSLLARRAPKFGWPHTHYKNGGRAASLERHCRWQRQLVGSGTALPVHQQRRARRRRAVGLRANPLLKKKTFARQRSAVTRQKPYLFITPAGGRLTTRPR